MNYYVYLIFNLELRNWVIINPEVLNPDKIPLHAQSTAVLRHAGCYLELTWRSPTVAPSTSSSNDPRLSVSEYEMISILGHSNSGTIYKARHRRAVAVTAQPPVLKLFAPGTPLRPTRLRYSCSPPMLRVSCASTWWSCRP